MRENMSDGGRPYTPIYNCLSDLCISFVLEIYQRPLGARQEQSTIRLHGQRHEIFSKEYECQAFPFQRLLLSGVRDLGRSALLRCCQ
jgi:hypothetical protein